MPSPPMSMRSPTSTSLPFIFISLVPSAVNWLWTRVRDGCDDYMGVISKSQVNGTEGQALTP